MTEFEDRLKEAEKRWKGSEEEAVEETEEESEKGEFVGDSELKNVIQNPFCDGDVCPMAIVEAGQSTYIGGIITIDTQNNVELAIPMLYFEKVTASHTGQPSLSIGMVKVYNALRCLNRIFLKATSVYIMDSSSTQDVELVRTGYYSSIIKARAGDAGIEAPNRIV